MKTSLLASLRLAPLILAPLLLAAAAHAGPPVKPLRVIATIPTYGALAREIGGELVEVTTLCRSSQDVHSVAATPALIERIRDADLLLYTGLDLEIWLDPMMRAAGNLDLIPGSAKTVQMSDGVQLKEVPSTVDRSKGDVHAFGNPHVWTDPLSLRVMAQHVADALSAARPEQKAEIEARRKAFHEKLTAALVDWLKRYAPLKGKPVIVYHRSWIYLLDRFGLLEAGSLEPKPRVAPTASHLQEVIELIRQDGAKVILREPWQAPDAADFVAGQTGAKVIELAQFPEPCENGADLIGWYERALSEIAAAMGVTVPGKP
jgi:zinc/manganese transport system substrate-binding protein